MSLDSSIEFFTYELFNCLWLDYELISEPLPLLDQTPVESELREDIVKAVKVRQFLFTEFYTEIFAKEYKGFKLSTADAYDFLVRKFPHNESLNPSVMERFLAICAFVAEMCQFSHSQSNSLFLPHAYLICAMFIDQELKTQFYAEGGWFALIRTSQSYVLPYAFLVQFSSDPGTRYGNHYLIHHVRRTISAIDSFQRFIRKMKFLESCSTLKWVDHCLEEENFLPSISYIVDAGKPLSVKELETTLILLKDYSDPLAKYEFSFDGVRRICFEKEYNFKKFLNVYFQYRPQEHVIEPEIPESDFLLLETYRQLNQINNSPESKLVDETQNYNPLVGDNKILELQHSELATQNISNQMDSRTVSAELEEKQGTSSNLNPCLHNAAEVLRSFTSKGSNYEVLVPHSNTIEVTGEKNLNKSLRTVKTSPCKKEINPTIRSPIAKLSPEKTSCGFHSAMKAPEGEKDKEISKFSNLDINSCPSHRSEISLNCARSPDARKRKGSLDRVEKNNTMLKLCKFPVKDEIKDKDCSTCSNLQSQGTSRNVSRISKVEKTEVTQDLTDNTSEPCRVKLFQDLPQRSPIVTAQKKTSRMKPVTNKSVDQKASDNIEDIRKHLRGSASKPNSGKGNASKKMTAVEDSQDRTNTSQTLTAITSPDEPSIRKKTRNKSKLTEEVTRPKTRREHLEETEEYAHDILRMTIVLGTETGLKFIKATLQSNKDI